MPIGSASVMVQTFSFVVLLALMVNGKPDGSMGFLPYRSLFGVNFKPSSVHLERETRRDDFLASPQRFKRDPEHHVEGPMYMTLEEGEYYYKEKTIPTGIPQGIYILSEPDQNIEIRFNYLDVSCENGGLVAVVDGWELNGEIFPSPEDHPKALKSRFNEFCGRRKIKQTFSSSQNVALIQYRMPARGASFSFNVKFVRNPSPCNVLIKLDETYTLRNYNRRSNCSISSLFPASVKVLDLNVGITPSNDRGLEFETGPFHKVRSECQKRGLDDYVQIGGSLGLDNGNMQIADSLCGLSSKPGRHTDYIKCDISTVRLVSSGAFDNSVTVSLNMLTENNINFYTSVVCIPEDFAEEI